MTYERTFEHKLKIRLVGDRGVGKSSLVARFVDEMFTESYILSTGVFFKTKTEKVDGDRVSCEVWDPPHAINSGFHGLIIVYDITDYKSINNIQQLLKTRTSEDQPVLLVGTKADLEMDRQVEKSDIEKVANNIPNCLGVIEASSKMNENVTEAFNKIATVIVRQLRGEEKSRDEQLTEKINATISKDQKKYMLKLDGMWNKNSHVNRKDEQKIIDVLKDYTSGRTRFFTGKWNRHHIKEIKAIVNNAGGKTSEELLSEIKGIKLANPQGSVAAIIHLIEDKLKIPLEKRFMPNVSTESPSHSYGKKKMGF